MAVSQLLNSAAKIVGCITQGAGAMVGSIAPGTYHVMKDVEHLGPKPRQHHSSQSHSSMKQEAPVVKSEHRAPKLTMKERRMAERLLKREREAKAKKSNSQSQNVKKSSQ